MREGGERGAAEGDVRLIKRVTIHENLYVMSTGTSQ